MTLYVKLTRDVGISLEQEERFRVRDSRRYLDWAETQKVEMKG